MSVSSLWVCTMNKARIAVLGLALVTAIGAAFLVKSMTGATQVTVVEGPKIESVEVLVAAKDINLGTLISGGDLRWQEWPKSALSGHLITKTSKPDAASSFAGATVRVPFVSGEPIIDKKVIRPGQGGFMAAILPKGMRAISVKISVESGVGGFILPNDRVDVLLTRRLRSNASGGNEEHVSDTVLKNVRVLAIDQTFSDSEKGEQVAIGKTATLELKPEQSEMLALAEAMGDISLTLRSIMESSNTALGEMGPVSTGSLTDGDRNRGKITMLRYGIASTVNTRK